MNDETRDSSGRLVSVVVDGQRFHRAPEAIEERSDEDGFTVPTWQDLRQLADHNFGLYAEAAAEVRSLRGVVRAQQVRLAAVEALLPWSDEEFPIFPYQLREALGAQESDFLLIPRAALAAAADAPQPEPEKITYGPRVPSRRVDLGEWDSHRPDFLPDSSSSPVQPADPPTCEHGRTVAHQMPNTYALVICPGPSPAVLPEPREQCGDPNPGTRKHYRCTEPSGHDGDHITRTPGCPSIFARWPVSGVAGNPDE